MKKLTMLFALALVFLPALHAASNAPVFHALLSPSTEVPPIVGSPHSGDSTVQIHLTRDPAGVLTQAIVDFRVNYNFATPETLRVFHIHKAPAGQNGGVVIDPGFAPPITVEGAGSVFRHVVVTAPATLAIVEEILANPAGFYVNVHTATSPGGAIRGQLEADPTVAISQMVAADSAKLDAMKTQLDAIQRMLRDIGRVFGLTYP